MKLAEVKSMPNQQEILAKLFKELEAALSKGNTRKALFLKAKILQELIRRPKYKEKWQRRLRRIMKRLDDPKKSNRNLARRGARIAPKRKVKKKKIRGKAKKTGVSPEEIKGALLGKERQKLIKDLTVELASLGELRTVRTNKTKGETYAVWFATNRKQDGEGGFTGERADQITRGRVDVFVPEAHRFGEIDSSVWKKLVRWDFRDDKLKIQTVTRQDMKEFYEQIQQSLEIVKTGGTPSHALIYLHGYNVKFEEAAIRAAQLGCDLKVPGATAFFSWPSLGSKTGYPADASTIDASEWAITQFLIEFGSQTKADKVHIVAHSMGNRGLLRSMVQIASKAESSGKIKFGQIFLAAPDVDQDLFLQLASVYPPNSDRTTLYASDRDKAVHLSALLHKHPRAGYYPPYTVLNGIDTVTVPFFNVDFLGHSYFANAEALLHDIYDLMRHNQPPNSRQRLESITVKGQQLWQLKK